MNGGCSGESPWLGYAAVNFSCRLDAGDQRSAAVRGDGRLVQDLAQLEAQLEPTGMLTRREKNAGGVG